MPALFGLTEKKAYIIKIKSPLVSEFSKQSYKDLLSRIRSYTPRSRRLLLPLQYIQISNKHSTQAPYILLNIKFTITKG